MSEPPRIYAPPESFSDKAVLFGPKDVRYLTKTLRLKTGSLVTVFDGRGEHLARLVEDGQGGVRGVVESSRMTAGVAPLLTLAFGCVRPGPMAEIFRHGTELGVTRFAPLLTSRSTRKPLDRKSRWTSIVESAAGQSGRTSLPGVESPMPLEDFVRQNADATGTLKLILTQAGESVPLPAILEQGAYCCYELIVGPEGGLSPEEERLAWYCGFNPAGLGDNTLRAETAAIVAVGIIVVRFGWKFRSALRPPVGG